MKTKASFKNVSKLCILLIEKNWIPAFAGMTFDEGYHFSGILSPEKAKVFSKSCLES
jgi:hypothetical protein